MITTIDLLLNPSESKPPVPLRPIVFISCLNEVAKTVGTANFKPTEWDSIVLLKKGRQCDVMYAFDSSRPHDGCVYIGHWNDGVKE